MKNEDTTMPSLTETAAPANSAAADHVQSDPQAPLAQPTRQPVRAILESNALLMLVVAIGIFFAILPKSRGTFLSASNLAYLLGNQATVALLALAAILPLICGYFDFSVGANSALATVFEARHAEVEAQRKLIALQRDLSRTQAQLALKLILDGGAQ